MLLSSLFLVALRPQNPAPKLRLVPGAGEQRIVDIEVSADARRVVTNGLVMGAYHSNATRLWDAKRGRVIAVFTHSWPIYSTDLSDRANRVLTVSKDEAKVWDATTGALVKRITSPEKEKFDRGAISPDGTHVILGTESAVVVSMAVEGSEEPKTSVIGGFGLSSLSYSKDGAFVVATPKIFDDEKPVQPVVLRAATLEPVSKLDDPRGASRVAELSPQGDRALTVAPGEKLDRARLFNVPDGRLLFERPYEDANEFETSAPATFVGKDGEAIAVPQANGTIALVDGRDGHAVGELLGVTGPLVAIKASPDGAVLAAAGLDGKIRAWTVSDRQPIPLPDSDARGVALAYSTDGQTLFAGEANGSLRRIDLRQCSVSSPLGPGSRIFADLLTFPNGRFAFGQRRGKSWQWQTFDALSRTESRVRLPLSERPPVFAADGTRAVILAPNGKPGALIVNVATGRVQSVPDASVAAWNSKGTWILTFGPNGVVRRFDGLTFAQTHSGSMKVKGAPRECAISPDGKTAAVVGYLSPEISKQELTVLWDVAAGKPLDVPFTSVDPKTKIHFSPNGKLLGLLDEHRILLYEMSTKTSKVAELFGPLKLDGKNLPATLHDFSFSADEKRMIASGLLGAIYPIDLVTGKFKAVDGPGYLGALDLWSFSRDLRTGLCVNGNNVEVWDMASQKIVGNMPLKDGSLKAAFLPDERRVVTSDMTDGIVVWDLSDPTAPKRLGSFLAVSDGRWLAMDGEGRFDAADPSAAEGASYVYGWSGGLEPIEISQMKSRYYEPGLLGKLLGIDPAPRRAVPDVAALQIYPEVRLSAKEDRFGIEVSDRDDGGVGTVELFVNGKSFKRRKGGGFFNVDFDSLRPFLIPPARLRPGERNELRVVAGNESDDLRSPSVGEEIPLPADLSAPPVHMYALCAGVGDYVGTTGDLKSPPSDATAIADALRKVSKRLLPEGVEVTVLTTDAKTEDGRPSRARLALWFEETSRKATASDIVLVFLAGHGTSRLGEVNDYFFLTADADPGDLQPSAAGVSVFSGEELRTALAKIPAAKQVVVLDTCHSGAASKSLVASRSLAGDYGRAYESIRDASGTWVLAGAAANQLAYEAGTVDHGMLTYALLEAIDRATPDGLRKAQSGDLFVDVETWLKYAVGRVESLKSELDLPGVQQPELRTSTSSGSFDIGVTNPANRGELGLQAPKPVVIVGSFAGANDEDPLRLEKAVGAIMGDSKKVKPWLDVASHPGVFRIAGSYAVAGKVVTLKLLIQRFDAAGDRKTLKSIVLTGSKADPAALAGKVRAATESELSSAAK